MPKFSLERYSAILFDLDSTLLDTGGYASEASKWILRHSTDDWSEILEDFITVLVEMYHNEVSQIAGGGQFKRPINCVRDALISALKEFDIEPEHGILREGLELFRELHIEYASPADGLLDVVEALQRNSTKMGVITNTFQGNARAILTNLDLDHYFSVIADSSDYRAFKPMPQPFVYAMEKLNVDAEHTLYVGDEFYADVVGAGRVGLPVIWINRRNVSLAENLRRYGVQPTLVISSFSELKNFI